MGLSQKRPIEPIKDLEIREHIKEIQESALGNVIQLSAAPTAEAPLLEDNEIGRHGNNIWIRIANILYRIATDEQITIT